MPAKRHTSSGEWTKPAGAEAVTVEVGAPAAPDRDQVISAAVEAAYEVWRNRPGRADPALVREALEDAAGRAYDGAQKTEE